VAVHRWVREACTRRGTRLLCAAVEARHLEWHRAVLETWGIYMSEERPQGVPSDALALHLVLDDAVLDRKLAALDAMPSQIGPSLARLTAHQFRVVNRQESFVPG
jgi:hypothetical protein